MDPNATLAELRALLGEDRVWDSDDIDRMAELIRALDGWMSSGGFLPKAWDRP